MSIDNLPPLRESLGRSSASLKRAIDRAPALRPADIAALRGELDELEALIAQVRQALLARDADDLTLDSVAEPLEAGQPKGAPGAS